MKSVRILGSTAGLALLALFGGCGGETPEAPPPSGDSAPSQAATPLSGTVKVDGSSTVYVITEAVAEDFRTPQPDVKVTVGISGTGGGFKKFVTGETDIADASRPISEEEMAQAEKNGVEYIEIPVAYDALTVAVHPDNGWVDKLTVAELKKIWEPGATGKLNNWSQVRAGWPNEKLKLYGPGSDSGTFDYFTHAIVGKEKSSRGDYTASEDDNVLVQGISKDKGALGYFGLAYYMENQDKLKAVPIDDGDSTNGDGAVQPSKETVIDGTYQPLSRPIFIYVNKKSSERPEVKAFVDFYLEKAGELSGEVGYVPLQDDVYDLVRQRFGGSVTGTLFGGKAAVGVNLSKKLSESGGSSQGSTP